MMKLSLFSWAGLLWSISAAAQTHYRTLASCIRLAQDSQYVIRNAMLEEQQADADRQEARRAFLPTLGAESSYNLSGTRITGSNSLFSSALATSLPLFQGGYLKKQLAYRQALCGYATGQRKRAAAGVKWTVVELYLKAVWARADQAAAQQVLGQLGDCAKAPTGYTVTYLLQKYSRVVTSQEQEYQMAYQQLMEYLYQPLGDRDSLVPPDKIIPAYTRFDTAIANGMLTDAGLKADRLNLGAMQALVAYKKRAAWPLLDLAGYYGPLWQGTTVFRYPGTDLSGQLLIRLSLPLFNVAGIRKEKEQAGISAQQAAAKLAEDERLLYQDMLRYYAQHRLSVQNLHKADEALAAAGFWFGRAKVQVDGLVLLQATDQFYTALQDRNRAWYQLVYQTLWIDFNSGQL